jgi:hypothetical protein
MQEVLRTKNRSLWEKRMEDPGYQAVTEHAENMDAKWQADKPKWLGKPGSLGHRRIKPDPAGKFFRD